LLLMIMNIRKAQTQGTKPAPLSRLAKSEHAAAQARKGKGTRDTEGGSMCGSGFNFNNRGP